MNKINYFSLFFLIVGMSPMSAMLAALSMGEMLTIAAKESSQDVVLALGSQAQDTDFSAAFKNALKSTGFKNFSGFKTELEKYKSSHGGGGAGCLTAAEVQAEIKKAGVNVPAVASKADAAKELVNFFDANNAGGKLLQELDAQSSDINAVKSAIQNATKNAK